MAIDSFYVSPTFESDQLFRTPEDLLAAQLDYMVDQVAQNGCSAPQYAPVNGALVVAYKELGDRPSLEAVVDYDPLQVLPDALMLVTGVKKATRYNRTFAPGQGEGTHSDIHDLVLTYTMGGKASFTIDTTPPYNSHVLGRHNIVLFNGRLPHEVSAPMTKGLRTITAFAVDL